MSTLVGQTVKATAIGVVKDIAEEGAKVCAGLFEKGTEDDET